VRRHHHAVSAVQSGGAVRRGRHSLACCLHGPVTSTGRTSRYSTAEKKRRSVVKFSRVSQGCRSDTSLVRPNTSNMRPDSSILLTAKIQAMRVATQYAPALSFPVGAQAPRAPPNKRNVAVLSHTEYVTTLTAAAALCVKAALSKAAW